MEMKRAFQDFKEKLKNQESTDCVELEKCFREIKTELFIKRDEVKQLRTDLDATNLEVQSLKAALDKSKKSADENQFNLNLVLKKSRSNEEELQEKRESLMKIQLQHNMTIAEVETLKEKLQKTELDKIDLTRKVDVFEAKQRHNSIYHNEISKRDNHLRNFMAEVNEMIVKLQEEHIQAIELSKKSQLAEEALAKLKFYASENEKLKKEKEQFEEMYIKVNAKYEKLEELMTAEPRINTPNLMTKIIFNQWKMNRSHYEAQMHQRDEILNKLTESYSNEKRTNLKLIDENEKIKERNTYLEHENVKLKEIRKNNEEDIPKLDEKSKKLEENLKRIEKFPLVNEKCEVQIKDEPILIDD